MPEDIERTDIRGHRHHLEMMDVAISRAEAVTDFSSKPGEELDDPPRPASDNQVSQLSSFYEKARELKSKLESRSASLAESSAVMRAQ